MSRKITFRQGALLLMFVVFLACKKEETTEETAVAPAQPQPASVAVVPRPEPDSIAAQIPPEAATVKTKANGTVGAPVVVVEENHVSPAGQLEAAIALSRLHEQFALKRIVVEGYLKDAETIQRAAVWLRGSPVERARVAAHLVGEGDIGGPEFVALVFTDVVLDHGEAAGEYASGIQWKGEAAFMLYLTQVALNSLDVEAQAKVGAYAKELGAGQEQDVSQRSANALKMAEFVIGEDPWSKDVWAKYRGENGASSSIEDEISLVESVKARADQSNVSIPPDLANGLNEHIAFLKQRSAASGTIVASVASIADLADVPIVAVEIGAGHSERAIALLREQTRPFVLVSLNGLNDKSKRGMLTLQEMERKYKQQPVSQTVVESSLLGAYPVRKVALPEGSSGANRPQVVLQQEWFKAKTELYASTQSIVAAVGGGARKPPNGPTPSLAGGGDDGQQPGPGTPILFVWSPDDQRRKDLESNQFVHIDPSSIELLNAPGRPTEVLFKAVIGSGDSQKTLWVKAGLVRDLNPDVGKTVEDVLKLELDKVTHEDRSSTHDEAASENMARVQLTLDTKAVFATTREEALNTEILY